MQNKYTFKELLQKYGLEKISSNHRYTIEQQITFFKIRGIIINLLEVKKSAYYEIIDDTIFNYEWTTCPFDVKYEVSKEGYARIKEIKRLVGSLNKQDGYIYVNRNEPGKGAYALHRMIMLTFSPVQDAENYIVDHINGKRDDNKLENLRWLTQRQNSEERDKNYITLNKNFQACIQKFGYEQLNIFLEEILKNN